MNARDFIQRLDIEVFDKGAQNCSGGYTGTWTSIITVWGKVQRLRGSKYLSNGQLIYKNPCNISFYWQNNLDDFGGAASVFDCKTHRIKWGDYAINCISVENYNERNYMLTLFGEIV